MWKKGRNSTPVLKRGREFFLAENPPPSPQGAPCPRTDDDNHLTEKPPIGYTGRYQGRRAGLITKPKPSDGSRKTPSTSPLNFHTYAACPYISPDDATTQVSDAGRRSDNQNPVFIPFRYLGAPGRGVSPPSLHPLPVLVVYMCMCMCMYIYRNQNKASEVGFRETRVKCG